MHPWLFDTIPAYYALWLVAALVCGGAGMVVLRRMGQPRGASVQMVLWSVLAVLVGSKLLFLAESVLFPTETFIDAATAATWGWGSGFRIPGGILLLFLVLPFLCRVNGLPWPATGDRVAWVPMLAVGFIRVGCLLNGCCFGHCSALPWSLSFPPGSWVYWYQAHHGLIAPGAPASLPVQPLQIYFLLAAVLSIAVTRIVQRRSTRPGDPQIACLLVYFGSTALLEPLRANHLSLNHWLTGGVAVILASYLLLRRTLDRPPIRMGRALPERVDARRN